jgi:Flp pilus assembly protein TadD
MKEPNDRAPGEVVQQAYRLLRERRDEQNLLLLERAVDQFPEDPEIRLLFATALLPFRPEESPLRAAEAIDLDPDHPGRLTRAARLMFYLGEVEEARSYGARAAQLAPPDFHLAPDLVNLGGLLAALDGDDVLAEEALRAAVEAEPDDEAFARDLAGFLAKHGRRSEALGVIDRALNLASEHGKLERLRHQIATESNADAS